MSCMDVLPHRKILQYTESIEEEGFYGVVANVLVWFVGFYGISTFVVYLMSNPFLCK